MMSDLKTMVHVESRNLFCIDRKTSATPASPACVATRMCSTYFDFGAASYKLALGQHLAFLNRNSSGAPTFTFVPPLTDFSKEVDIDIRLVGGSCLVMQQLTTWAQ